MGMKVSLRLKITVFLILAIAISAGSNFYVFQRLIRPNLNLFDVLEAKKDMDRVLQGIKRDMRRLQSFAGRLAAREETARHAATPNKEYEASHLPRQTLLDNQVGLLFIYGPGGKLITGKAYGLSKQEEIWLREFMTSKTGYAQTLLDHPDSSSVMSGIVKTDRLILQVVSRPIVSPQNPDQILGALLAGNVISGGFIRKIGEENNVKLRIWRAGDAFMPRQAQAAYGNITKSGLFDIHERPGDILWVYAVLTDAFGVPAILIRGEVVKKLGALGRRTLTTSLISLSISMTGILLLFWLFVNYWTISPLRKLRRQVLEVARNNDFTQEVSARRSDEIGEIGKFFNKLFRAIHGFQFPGAGPIRPRDSKSAGGRSGSSGLSMFRRFKKYLNSEYEFIFPAAIICGVAALMLYGIFSFTSTGESFLDQTLADSGANLVQEKESLGQLHRLINQKK